jgi:hypothetical protein
VKFWRERLLTERISLRSLPELISACFSHYSTQFMQIRNTCNKLISSST